jgi:hypothetical protein
MFNFKSLIEKNMDITRAVAFERAWQGDRGLERRHPARLEVSSSPAASAFTKGEFTEGAGPASTSIRSGSLWASCGHHAVQFPGHDSDVDVRRRDRLRQLLHPKASEKDPSVPLRLAEL